MSSFSIGCGATFFPPASTIRSFFRSVMTRNPSSSIFPMSPVWNQPSASIASAVASGLLKYPFMTCGPRVRISPSAAIFTSTFERGFPTVPSLQRVRPVHGDDGRGLRQTVPLVDHDARADEELREVARERRSPRDGVPEPVPEGVADLREDELVGDLRFPREPAGQRLAALLVGHPLAADADRPVEELLLQAAARLDFIHDAGVDLLVDARDGAESVRVDLDEVVPELVDRLRVGDRGATVQVGVVEHPLEDVRQREEGERDRVARDRDHLAGGRDVRDEVRVREHRALRLPRGARRIDDRGDVLGLYPGRALLEDRRAHLERRAALVRERVEREVSRLRRRARVEGDDVVERRALRLDLEDLAELLDRGHEDRLRAAVVHEGRDLVRGKRRVDRDGPGARAEDGVVGHRPLRPVLREDRDAVSRLDPERVQPERDRPDRETEVARGDGSPRAADFRNEKVRFPRSRRGEEHVTEGSDLRAHGPPPIAKVARFCRAPPGESRK